MVDIQEIYNKFTACNFAFSTDTRNIQAGVMFFCLKGDNFNANLFQEEAISKGASWVIGDEKHTESDRLILVDNVLKTLQDLSHWHRKKMQVKMIGIGGSNGKTTTKELLVSVLSTTFKTHFTQGNLNNHIGVPMTLLNLRSDHQISVVELGTNRAGDVKELCLIAEPDMGIITNIGKEHLEGFGSIQGVAEAEGELFEFLKEHNGHAFVNGDDHLVFEMGKNLPSTTVYTTSADSVSNLKLVPKVEFDYKGQHFISNLPGQHNFQNIIAVLAIAEYLGMDLKSVSKGIEEYKPKNNRSQILEGKNGNIIFLDAYNANPSSVEMALKTLEGMPGEKLILLGDMFELGAYEAQEHQAIAEVCASIPNSKSILVGKAFAGVVIDTDNVHLFADKVRAKQLIEQLDIQKHTVLIKGSRGMKMEEFLPLF